MTKIRLHPEIWAMIASTGGAIGGGVVAGLHENKETAVLIATLIAMILYTLYLGAIASWHLGHQILKRIRKED